MNIARISGSPRLNLCANCLLTKCAGCGIMENSRFCEPKTRRPKTFVILCGRRVCENINEVTNC